jgi:hypothetical protein
MTLRALNSQPSTTSCFRTTDVTDDTDWGADSLPAVRGPRRADGCFLAIANFYLTAIAETRPVRARIVLQYFPLCKH